MELIYKLLLIFMQAPSQFRTRESRVLYASTFLKGSTAHWFSNFLIQQPPPRVVTNWNVFVQELNAMFGDRNRVCTAQQAVLTLQMNNNHQVSRYVVEYQRWADLSGFNEVALEAHFYEGLPRRIKNDFQRWGRSYNYITTRDDALRYDQRFWDTQSELMREGAWYATPSAFPPFQPGAPNGGRAPRPNTSQASLATPAESNPQPRDRRNNNPRERPSGSNNNNRRSNPSTTPRDPSTRLTTDGHITLAERDRRREPTPCDD